jgi:hypothetical protein
VWEGRLRSGPHRIVVSAPGYWTTTRDVALRTQDRQVVTISLERDLSSPVWGVKARPRFAVALDGAFAVTPVSSGQVQSACTSPCSGAVPVGGLALASASYELPLGLGVGVEGGYLGFVQTLVGRGGSIAGSAMRATDVGSLDDRIAATGVLVGAALSYRRGESWPMTVRVSLGVYVSSVTDQRQGIFTTSSQGQPPNTPYGVGMSESRGATFVYAAPEVRVARRLGERLEMDAGLKLLVLTTPSPPAWTDANLVHAGPPGTQGDGVGQFGTQTLTSSILFVVAPGIGARYEF